MERRAGVRGRLAVAAALVAVVAALLWQALPEPLPPGVLVQGGDAAAAPAASSGAASPQAVPESPGDTLRAAADVVPALELPTVQVVDERGDPVVGARVQWTTREWENRYLDFAPFDVEVEFATAPVVTTDSRGFATLPADVQRAFGWARQGERFGQAMLVLDEPLLYRALLEIRPDVTIRAVVRGPGGEAFADVPVLARFQEEESVDPGGFTQVYLGRSDRDGRVALAHAACLRSWSPAAPLVALRAVVLGAATEWTPWSDGDARELSLRCPPHGRLRVQVPPAVPGTPTLALRDEPERGKSFSGNGTFGERLAGDRILFPAVALDRSWLLRLERCEELEVMGPTRHGQVVDAVLQPAAGLPLLRLLLPSGAPCANRRVLLRSIDPDDPATEAVTDGDGIVRFVPWAVPTLVVVSPADRAEAELSPAPQPADRGFTATLRLEPQRVLVAGRTVDAASGAPIAAVLWLKDESWTTLQRVASGPDGSFEFLGRGEQPRWLCARSEPSDIVRLPVAAGATQLIVRIPRSRQLAVTLLVDADVPLDAFHFAIAGHAMGARYLQRAGRRDAVVLLPDGDDLVLEVAADTYLAPLLRVPMAEWQAVSGGFRVTVDLRGQLATATVEVRCDAVVVPATVYVRGSSDDDWRNYETSRFRFAMRRGGTWAAIVAADAHGCAEALLRPGHNIVEVPAAATLQVTVHGVPPELPVGVVGVRVFRLALREPLLDQMYGSEPPPRLPQTAEQLAALDGPHPEEVRGEPGRFTIARRGAYAVVPFVRRGERSELLAPHAKAVDVDVHGARVDTTVTVPPEAVRAAWDRLER
ncbi:MAG: hypothetical protein WAT39_07430 [Planctomycetota bacterium]